MVVFISETLVIIYFDVWASDFRFLRASVCIAKFCMIIHRRSDIMSSEMYTSPRKSRNIPINYRIVMLVSTTLAQIYWIMAIDDDDDEMSLGYQVVKFGSEIYDFLSSGSHQENNSSWSDPRYDYPVTEILVLQEIGVWANTHHLLG